MYKEFAVDQEITMECSYTNINGFYFVKLDGYDKEINTYEDNLVPLEPEKKGEWKRGLVGMHISEDRDDSVVARISDILNGRVEEFVIPKERIFF